MAIIIQSKTRYQGTHTPSALDTEETVIEISGASDDYMVEGYIDLSQLQDGDEIEIAEYISVDGTNYYPYAKNTYSGVQDSPILRFHTKTLLYNMKYKITIKQTSGTIRSFPYGFIQEVMGSSE